MTRESDPSAGGPDAVVISAISVATALAIVWAGAQLAARVQSGAWLPATGQDTASALMSLSSHFSEPALAWPARVQPDLPGAGVYWACTAVVGVAAVLAAVQLIRLVSGSGPAGMAKRMRLGVDTQSFFARRRDLRTLIVRRPGQPGRFVLGTVRGRLVATEDRHHSPVRGPYARQRQGDRMGVAVIGPTRTGKTANLIPGILEWPGPAILSSTKDEFLEHTLAHRARLGEVKVFDPTRTTTAPDHLRARWSPLRMAHTATGAQRAARAVSDIVPMGDVTSGGFWNASADQLLWPSFFAARWGPEVGLPGGLGEVVSWTLTYNTADSIEVCDRLIADHEDPSVRRDAAAARLVLDGFRHGDPKTVASIYQTAQPMLRAIQDPLVVDATAECEINFAWLCDPTQSNTLYVCAPTHDQKRLDMVFGGLFGDLLAQQAYEHANQHGPLDIPLLVVMDEAANTPCAWLPHVASTCSGIGVLLITVWQDISQIKAAYKSLAGSVLNNHGTKIFFTGQSDLETQQYVTAQCGGEEIENRSVSLGDGSRGRSLQISGREVTLVPGHLQRRMKPGNAILIHGTLPPAHLVWRQWWKDRTLRRWRAGEGDLPSWMPTAQTAEVEVPGHVQDQPDDRDGSNKPSEAGLPPTTGETTSAKPSTAAELAARAGLASAPPPPLP